MIQKASKLHLKKLLSDAIPLLCKNGLPPHTEFRVEAMIGITVDGNELALICINETVTSDGDVIPQMYGIDEDPIENEGFCHLGSGDDPLSNPEQYNNGNESYGGAINMGEFEVKQEVSENDVTGYENMENTLDSDGYLCGDGAAMEGGGYARNAGRNRPKNRKSFAAGSGQFVKDEFGQETDDCIMVKDELEFDESVFSDSFGFTQDSGSFPIQSRSSGHRSYNSGGDFVPSGAVSLPSTPWQNKMKKNGPLRKQKVPVTKPVSGKASRNPISGASVELQSPADQRQFLNNLCREMVQDSIVQTQYFCHICNTKLSSKSSLATHIKGSHINAKLYSCNQCEQSFKWYMQLYRHKKYYHSGM